MTCRHCDYLASEVMRLREDRNEWRRMYIELMALLYALGIRSKTPRTISQKTACKPAYNRG